MPGAAGAHRRGDIVGPHARGDEGLLAVDDIVVAVAPRGGPQVGNVGAAAGLGDGERRDLLAGEHRGSTRALIACEPKRAIGGAPMVWLLREAEMPPDPARASSCAETIHMKRSPGVPPYSSGKPRLQQPDRGGLLVELARELARLVPFGGEGLDFFLDKAAHHVAKGFVFGGVEWACHPLASRDSCCGARCPETAG